MNKYDSELMFLKAKIYVRFHQRLLREDMMKESVIYQEIKSEGKQEGETRLILRLLNRRIGDISPQFSQSIQSLSVEELENLGEALLDFQSVEDLLQWLTRNYTQLK